MPQYITATQIKERLLGKVRFTNDDTDENAVSSGLLETVIEEAEGEVEMRLSPRYYIPFQGQDGCAFESLPLNTKTLLKTLCRLEATHRLLGLDFGRGSAADGAKFQEIIEKDYEARLERLVSIRDGSYNVFKYPPLENLKLGIHNEAADDGFQGQIFVTSDNLGGGAPGQMPSPQETIFNGVLFEP